MLVCSLQNAVEARRILEQLVTHRSRVGPQNEARRFGGGDPLRTPTDGGPEFLYERTKSSVFHYRAIYGTDERLARWAQQLEAA